MATMNDLGEKAFLKALLPELKTAGDFINGFGHDASVIDIGLDQLIASKIDRAPFPIALKHHIGDYRTWGRLAVAANVSDLLAVGAKPRALMLSLVVPGNFNADDARNIVLGCEESCIAHGISFVGGDTKEGSAAQVIGAAWGTIEKGAEYGRCPAISGDKLYIAGQLGAFTGSVALINANTDGHIPQSWGDALTLPMARCVEGKFMRESRLIAAACDISDGLSEAIKIFSASKDVGITVRERDLPMHALAYEASKTLNLPLWKFAFGVGDWAIAFVVKRENDEAFKRLLPEEILITEIGQFNNSGELKLEGMHGQTLECPSIINEHFRHRAEDTDKHYMDELLSDKKTK